MKSSSKFIQIAVTVVSLVTGVPIFVQAANWVPPTSKAATETANSRFQSDIRKHFQGSSELNTNDLKGTNQQLRELLDAAKVRNKSKAQEIQRGGVDTGGGTIVRTSQGVGLLDLFIHDQNAFFDRVPGTKLPETRAYKAIGIERLNSPDFVVYQKTMQLLLRWKDSSPLLIGELEKALSDLPIFYLAGKMTRSPEAYSIPENLSLAPDALEMVAIYEKTFGVFISKQIFDSLSEKNQMALLIHESLRHMQITGESLISNSAVQRITAQILKGPGSIDTLDTTSSLEGLLLIALLEKMERQSNVLSKSQSICESVGYLCEVPNLTDEKVNFEFSREYERINRAIQQGHLSSEQIENLIDARDEMDRFFQKRLVHSFGEAVDGLTRSTGKLSRFMAFGALDLALDDVNKSGWFSSRYREMLKEVRTKLTNAGLMNLSDTGHF